MSFQFNFETVQLTTKFRVAQMHWESGSAFQAVDRSKVESARTNRPGLELTATVQVSQMISKERAPWRTCTDWTGM